MKHLSLLLGIAVGFVAPLAAHAEPAARATDTAKNKARTKTTARRDRVVVTAPAPTQKKPARVRYEVTTITAVGSHLPVVIYRYKGDSYVSGDSFAPHKAYRHEGGGIDSSGALSVSGELSSLDPAFH